MKRARKQRRIRQNREQLEATALSQERKQTNVKRSVSIDRTRNNRLMVLETELQELLLEGNWKASTFEDETKQEPCPYCQQLQMMNHHRERSVTPLQPSMIPPMTYSSETTAPTKRRAFQKLKAKLEHISRILTTIPNTDKDEAFNEECINGAQLYRQLHGLLLMFLSQFLSMEKLSQPELYDTTLGCQEKMEDGIINNDALASFTLLACSVFSQQARVGHVKCDRESLRDLDTRSCVGLVLRSLQALYSCVLHQKDTTLHASVLSGDDCFEAFHVLTKGLLYAAIRRVTEPTLEGRKQSEIVCIQFLCLLRTLLSAACLKAPFKPPAESILPFLLLATTCSPHQSGETDTNTVQCKGTIQSLLLSVLHGICPVSPDNVPIFCYARIIITMFSQGHIETECHDTGEIDERLLKLHAQLLLWNRSEFSKCTPSRLTNLLCLLQQTILDKKGSSVTIRRAVLCLSMLTVRVTSCDPNIYPELRLLISHTITELLLCDNDEVKWDLLATFFCLRNFPGAPILCLLGLNDLRQSEERAKKLIASLVKFILQDSGPRHQNSSFSRNKTSKSNVKNAATAILLDLFNDLLKRRDDCPEDLRPREVLSICRVLLDHEDFLVVHQVTQFVCWCLYREESARSYLIDCNDVLDMAGVVHLCRQYHQNSNCKLPNTILSTWRFISDINSSSRAAIICQPRLLDVVVESSLGGIDVNTFNRENIYARQLSIVILVNLAKDASNQRILARQIGLIPSLIRFAKEIDVDGAAIAGDRRLPSLELQRDTIKDRILSLATAL